jgi:hypothetical protein
VALAIAAVFVTTAVATFLYLYPQGANWN